MHPFLTVIILITSHVSVLQSQIDPLSTCTKSSRSMPRSQSSLLPGYHLSTNRIWLLGGDKNTGSDRDEVWYYDINGNSFQDVRSITTDLDELFSQSSTHIGNAIYFANVGHLLRFDISTTDGTFNDLGAMLSTQILSPCLSKSNDERYIFIVGGEPSNDVDDGTTYFQIYDIQTTQFSSGDSLNSKRRFLSCNVSPDGTALYVFGGVYESGSSAFIVRKSIEKLDISDINSVKSGSARWATTSMTMNSNEWYSRSVVDYVNNLIYIIGGRTDDASQTLDYRIQIVDTTSDTIYTSSKRLTTGRAAPTVINIDQKIYVFGGYTVNNGQLSSFETCNILDLSPPTNSPTSDPTISPISISPTNAPSTTAPTTNPSKYPSKSPSKYPSKSPSQHPSKSPSKYPSGSPSKYPSQSPSKYPSKSPSKYPSSSPSNHPTNMPTNNPTTNIPTISPTMFPSRMPTNKPSNNPTVTDNAGSVIVETTHDSSDRHKQSNDNVDGTRNSYFVVIGMSLVFGLCCLIMICYGVCFWRRSRRKKSALVNKKVDDTNNTIQMGNMGVMIQKVGSVSSLTTQQRDIRMSSDAMMSVQTESVASHPRIIIQGENNLDLQLGEGNNISDDELYGNNNTSRGFTPDNDSVSDESNDCYLSENTIKSPQ